MGRFVSTKAIRRARQQQCRWAGKFVSAGCPTGIRLVGGVDIAFEKLPGKSHIRPGAVGSRAVVVAVVWDMAIGKCVEAVSLRRRVTFPYVPGLLSFREAPLVISAIKRVKSSVEVWMLDGHGIAHPRGCGLATHVGVKLRIATIGVAKSLLVGHLADHQTLPASDGALGRMVCPWQGGHRFVGYALRPQATEEPLYISPGNNITAEQALHLVAGCLQKGKRLPEPTRLADKLCGELRLFSGTKRRQITAILLGTTV